MGIEKNLVLVCGSKFAWSLCEGIEIDLILEWGSIGLDCSNSVEINLIVVCGMECDLVLVLISK